MKQNYTVPEAAEIAKCDISYIRRLCATGRLKAQKRGRDWIILEPENKLKNLIDKR